MGLDSIPALFNSLMILSLVLFEIFLIMFSSFLLKPVVPITIFFFSLDAILRLSSVHFGLVKSIITFTFLNASIEFTWGLIPKIFLFIFTKKETH